MGLTKPQECCNDLSFRIKLIKSLFQRMSSVTNRRCCVSICQQPPHSASICSILHVSLFCLICKVEDNFSGYHDIFVFVLCVVSCLIVIVYIHLSG